MVGSSVPPPSRPLQKLLLINLTTFCFHLTQRFVSAAVCLLAAAQPSTVPQDPGQDVISKDLAAWWPLAQQQIPRGILQSDQSLSRRGIPGSESSFLVRAPLGGT